MLPPLLMAKIRPKAPISNPNAIGCPPAATTIGIKGMSGPCVPARFAVGNKKPEKIIMKTEAMRSS